MSSGAKILGALRDKLKSQGFDALWVPSSDPHMSEYVAERFGRRAFVSNFKGSAGTAVVPTAADQEAKLWTDGRYWLEAEDSLYPGWGLMKDGLPETTTITDYLKQVKSVSGEKATIAADPFTFTVEAWEQAVNNGVNLAPMVDCNVVDAVRGDELPALSLAEVFDLPLKFTGQAVEEKIKAVRTQLEKEGSDMLILSALDEIAWVLNLRGNDVECNPVFYSYVVITKDNVNIFIDDKKVPASLKKQLEELISIKFYPYNVEGGLKTFFKEASAAAAGQNKKLVCGIDKKQTSQGVKVLLDDFGISTKSFTPCVKRLKAIKNETELKGIKACHIRDGAALTRFLAWVDKEIKSGTEMTEVEAADKLEAFRREDDRFVQLSFATITSSGSSGAIIHYRAEAGKCRKLSKDEMYLVDSGAQYWDGTTDVTRNLVFSEPSELQKDAYTAVLKGHIAINTAVFPNGVTGHRIDSFARNALWSLGLDYAHGTGHGVGHFLNVHEGPHSIGTRPPVDPTAVLEKGMIVSNEPGYYQSGQFGIRIENLETIVEKETKYGLQYGGSEKKSSLGMEYLTMVPLCPELINLSALTAEEKTWINTYHAVVKKNLQPILESKGDKLAQEYLERTTKPL